MLPEENEVYGPYTPSYQQGPFESVAVLEDPPVTQAPSEQDTSPLPSYQPGQKSSPPPQNRPGRGGGILLLALIFAIIFSVGLFAGLEFASSSTGNTPTTSKTVVTPSTTSSGGTTVETLQEAAIAKVEPAVSNLR